MEDDKDPPPGGRRSFLKIAASAPGAALVPWTAISASGCASLQKHHDSPQYKNFAPFMELSRQLTGVRDLREDLGYQYFQRCIDDPALAAGMGELLDEFVRIQAGGGNIVDAIRTRIMATPHRAAAEQLIYLWYISAAFLPADVPPKGFWSFGSIEAYEGALVWKLIGAHAPMTTGGAYGHWSRPARSE